MTVIAALPMVTLTGSAGAVITAALPTPTVLSTAHNSYGENALIAALPMPNVLSIAGANSANSFPPLVLDITGTFWGLGTGDNALPMLTVDASGTATQIGTVMNTLPMFTLVGYSGGVVAGVLPMMTLDAAGTGGGMAVIIATLPTFDLTAAGTAQSHGGADLLLPMLTPSIQAQTQLMLPRFTLTAIGSATITVTYEAYALNLKHNSPDAADELTHYTNFPFTHVVRHKNSYYGVNSTGLYLLEGTTDAGAPIEWQFKTGISDFGKPNLKTVTYAYFGGRLGPAATVSIYPGESTGESYSYSTPRGQAAQNYRQQFGRGLKGRYFAIGALGAGEMKLDSLELLTETLTRRI